jgi:diguanylate cyclase (GGDEF)-like protein/PAS domain S-box-containing protein
MTRVELREADVRAVLTAVPVPALILRSEDGDGLVVSGFNDAAVRLTRGTVPRLVGRTATEAYAHAPGVADDLGRALRTGVPIVREGPFTLASDGTERLTRTHAVPVGDRFVLLLVEDLTEQTRAETLATSVIESLDDGVLAVDPHGKVILANRRAAEIIGLPLAELYAGGPWWEQLEFEEESSFPLTGPGGATRRALLGGETVSDVMVRLRRPSGGGAWVSVNFRPLGDDERPRGMVVSIRDVTDRRLAVERFEHAFEDAPIGMALVRFDGTFERVNVALCDVVGRPRSELEGARWPELVHPADRDDIERCLERVRAGDDPPAQAEHRLCLPDGSSVEALWTMSVVRDPGGGGEYAVCQFLDVSAQRRYEAELERRALQDHLTGLPNRALFGDRLEHALERLSRTRRGIGVVFLDVDEFKRVNDSLGHTAGDEVLVETARRLEEVVRAEDTICRFGGDEFVVLCEDLDADAPELTATALGERLLDRIASEPYTVAGQTVHLHASVGIAVARPGAQTTAERLVAESDAAMYRAKRRGSGRPEIAADETSGAARRLELEGDLREALSGEGGLWLAYQPIVDLVSGHLVGLEALLRWERPGHGPVFPGEIIPIAEESGLIVELGEWVMRRAIADLARWPGRSRPYVAINLGARQFGSSALVDQLRACLERNGVEPSRISLEITESVAMGDAERALATMRALKQVGVRIAIDDFGTGFSSLGYLKRFPADTVKIDREFIVDVAEPSEDRAIVEAVVSMARALELDVVAEGVETDEQRRALTRLGCRRAQGFLFARPAPLEDAVAVAG